jgi:hypothetical protein
MGQNMYNWTICEPFNPKVVDKGAIDKSIIIETFNSYAWADLLKDVEENPEKVCFSPSIEFIRQDGAAVTFSVFDKREDLIFMFFFKRNKMVKGSFGFGTKEKEIISDIDITFTESKIVLEQFLANDFESIENRFN